MSRGRPEAEVETVQDQEVCDGFPKTAPEVVGALPVRDFRAFCQDSLCRVDQGLFIDLQYWKLFWLLMALPEVMRRLSFEPAQEAAAR